MEDDFTLLGTLGKIKPDHFLVVAASGGTQGTTSQSSGGAGGDNAKVDQQAIVARMTRSATSDDARKAIESVAKALGLN